VKLGRIAQIRKFWVSGDYRLFEILSSFYEQAYIKHIRTGICMIRKIPTEVFVLLGAGYCENSYPCLVCLLMGFCSKF